MIYIEVKIQFTKNFNIIRKLVKKIANFVKQSNLYKSLDIQILFSYSSN